MGKVAMYSELEVHHLVRNGGHLVVEAGAIVARVVGGKHEVALPLFRAFLDDSVIWADYFVVNVEGAT